ncbi:MAG TPA: FAD-dependent oxidoreductase [Rhizobiaceae bacterium]|nr:FAD-dependent oxidoreductase [Rhizobiaceae bacterium]
MSSRDALHDVIVVGAGFTGLSAAVELQNAGLDVLLVEARDRVGGRVEARRNGLGELIDTGGQYFCDDMVEVCRLARRYDKTFVETPMDGEFLTQPPLSPADVERAYGQSMAIRHRLRALPLDDPSTALSVAGWLALQPEPRDAKAGFQSMIEGLWCMPIEDIPAWHLAETDRRVTNKTTELQYILRETMYSLAADLGAGLGDCVRLNSPVTRIERSAESARVVTAAGIHKARHALITMPPSMAAQLDYAPALPAPLADALGVWRSGTVIKALLRYARPFWRDSGASGMVAWRDIHGLFCCDASPDDNHAALVFFIAGPIVRGWQGNDAEVKSRILARLTVALGPEAGHPIDVSFRDWTDDRWSGGGYGDLITDPTARDAEDIIWAGAPPLHFAFSDIAPSFPGYVEGAIIAGRIAARKIVEKSS